MENDSHGPTWTSTAQYGTRRTDDVAARLGQAHNHGPQMQVSCGSHCRGPNVPNQMMIPSTVATPPRAISQHQEIAVAPLSGEFQRPQSDDHATNRSSFDATAGVTLSTE